MTNSSIDYQTGLIYIMVVTAAADSNLKDRELYIIGDLVRTLPVFRDYDDARLVPATQQCAEILTVDDGLDAVLGLAQQAIPDALYETAYAIACQVAAADGTAAQEELRLLEMLRDRFNIDRLSAAAIERGVAVLNRAP